MTESQFASRAQSWPPGQTRLYHAPARAALQIAGADARQWLNGMVSANVRELTPGRVAGSFQLDPKGHVLAMFEVLGTAPDCFWLLCDREQLPGLSERLRKYVFLSKVQIEDLSATWSALRLRGAEWRRAWESAGLEPLAKLDQGNAATVGLDGDRAWVIATDFGGVAQAEIWCASAVCEALRRRLAACAEPAGEEQAEHDRIVSGEPRYGVDITAAEVAQETGQLDRLSFTKGCYVGQEIVERVRARGAVHRHFAAFTFDSAVRPGATVEAQGREVGRITSATEDGPTWRALGYIRDPHQAKGTEVTSGGATGRVL
ncbi:MAG TPA: hypothetical protein VN690_07575 [Terriglobales bacterium]|nr:hypothetical protein [Terriglobales bacterium]